MGEVDEYLFLVVSLQVEQVRFGIWGRVWGLNGDGALTVEGDGKTEFVFEIHFLDIMVDRLDAAVLGAKKVEV